MDKKEQLILLLAELGAFFSKCDGDYDERESDFILRFLSSLQANDAVDETLRQSLEEMVGQEFSIEQILSDTRSFIKVLDKDEVAECMSAIEGFIEQLIHADGAVHPQEERYFDEWRKSVSSCFFNGVNNNTSVNFTELKN